METKNKKNQKIELIKTIIIGICTIILMYGAIAGFNNLDNILTADTVIKKQTNDYFQQPIQKNSVQHWEQLEEQPVSIAKMRLWTQQLINAILNFGGAIYGLILLSNNELKLRELFKEK